MSLGLSYMNESVKDIGFAWLALNKLFDPVQGAALPNHRKKTQPVLKLMENYRQLETWRREMS